MPMHISPNINKNPNNIATMLPRISPIANPLPSATQSDILDILQREQDRAVALLSSSPLLASLFVSYANQAAALDSATATPTSQSDEWKALENTIVTLQEEVDRLKPEHVEMTKGLEAAAASQEAFRSQVSALKEVNATQLGNIKTLRAELLEAKRTRDQLLVDSESERESLQTRNSELEARQRELEGTIVEQQVQIMKFQCRGATGLSSFSNAPVMETAGTRKFDRLEGKIVAEAPIKANTAEESAERVERMHRAEREARENFERAAMEKVEREERERFERLEREERERLEREEKEKADREAKEREEEEKRKATASKIPPTWGTNTGDRSRKTSALAQKEQKNIWAGTWGFGPTETKDEPSDLPPIVTSAVPGGIFDGAGKFDFFTKTNSPGHGARVSISENERFTDAEQGPPSPQPVRF